MSKHHAYVISSGFCHVKIGHSRDPKSRLSDLQVGSSSPLWLSHQWRVDRADAIELERRLHAAFCWCSLEGEWFDTLAPPVVAVGDLLLAGRDADAQRLLDIVQRLRIIPIEESRLRDAWRFTKSSDRRRVDLVSAAARKALDAEAAALELEAYDLGLWPEGATTERGLSKHLEVLRLRAA